MMTSSDADLPGQAMFFPAENSGDMDHALRLGDTEPDLHGVRLRAMAIQLWRMSREIEAAAQDKDAESFPTRAHLLETVTTLCARRRLRQKYMNPDLFGEPGWDMLLELYAASLNGKDISTTSLALTSGVPITTALRWIDHLSKAGLVERAESFSDRRVHYQILTKLGNHVMTAYFRHVLLKPDEAEAMDLACRDGIHG